MSMATIAAESRLSLFTSLLHLFLIRSNNWIEKIARVDSIDVHMEEMLINLTDSETAFLSQFHANSNKILT